MVALVINENTGIDMLVDSIPHSIMSNIIYAQVNEIIIKNRTQPFSFDFNKIKTNSHNIILFYYEDGCVNAHQIKKLFFQVQDDDVALYVKKCNIHYYSTNGELIQTLKKSGEDFDLDILSNINTIRRAYKIKNILELC